jgi:glycosyltransferase involved in cell wall biosynthesis
MDVVIPVRDAGPVFSDCIAAWIAQEIPEGWDVALFLVDDGSTDGVPAQIARTYPDSINLIRHGQSQGRASARNAGVDAGTGNYLAFFDADCFPMSNRVLAAYIAELENGVELAFGRLKPPEPRSGTVISTKWPAGGKMLFCGETNIH